MSEQSIRIEQTQHLVRVAVQAIGPSRSEELMGKEYVVFPAVMVRSQVLNNNLGRSLLPAYEFTETWAAQWNGTPVVAGEHPKRNGVDVSARDPEVLNTQGVGVIFNARTVHSGELAELKAEVWLDTSRTEEVPELQNILDSLEADTPVELSTGFMAFVEEEAGVFNGREFDLVMHPVGADHLAIFSEAIGACSVSDGCGLGVNQDGEGDMADEPTTTEQEPGWYRNFVDKIMSKLPGIGPSETVDNQGMSDDEKHRLIWKGLQDRFGGPGKELWIQDTFSDDGEVVFAIWSQGEGSELWMSGFEITEEGDEVTFTDPVRVIKRTVYEPASNEEADNPGGAMNRKQLIAHLAKDENLEESVLQKLSDCQLKALHEAESADAGGDGGSDPTPEGSAGGSDPAPTDGGSGPTVQGEGDPAPSNQQDAGVAAAMQELTAAIKGVREDLGALKSTQEEHSKTIRELHEVTAPAVQEQNREREELIESLASNERVPWEKDELEPKGLEELRRLAAMARGRTYAPRGGPKVGTQSADEPKFMAPKPHWETEPAGAGAGEG